MNQHNIWMTARAVILSASFFACSNVAQAVVQQSEIVPTWSGAEIGIWTLDYISATNNAAKTGSNTLLLFSGMWWCPHCQALEASVLTQDAWADYIAAKQIYTTVLDFPARNGKSNWCWLWETNYIDSAGLTMEEAADELMRRYSVQDDFSEPGAVRQTVTLDNGTTFDYGKIGYPTLLALRSDGTVAGRFSISKTNANLDYVTNRIEQTYCADEWDEPDNYYQTATELTPPTCEDEENFHGDHTLSIVDSADWYSIDVSSGVGGQWIFSFGENSAAPQEDLLVELYEDPTDAAVSSQVVTPGTAGIFSFIVSKKGTRWLKVSPTHNLQKVIGYSLSYQYTLAPATLSFASTNVTARSTDKAISLSVKIADASRDAEVIVDWVAEDGDALYGVDYSLANGTLTWPVNSAKSIKTISIPIIKQTEWKGDRSFKVRLYPRRNCVISSAVAECNVKIQEGLTRRPGTLSFDASLAKQTTIVREGETMTFDVSRIAGTDGVITGVVSLVVGRQTETLTNLVWSHKDDATRQISYTLPALDAFREDTTATLRLTAQGGARTSTSSLKLTLRDALVDETFAEYNKCAFTNALSVSGVAWFSGKLDEKDSTIVLRSRPLNGKKSSLSYKVKGPAIVEIDSQFLNGATAELYLGKKLLTNEFPARVAIPTGTQTLKLSAIGEDAAFVTAALRTTSLTAYRFTALLPRSGQAVIADDTLNLIGTIAISSSIEPDLYVETYAGTSASNAKVLGTNILSAAEAGLASFPQTEPQRDTLSALTANRLNKDISWRMDTVFTDKFGNRAVQQGMAATVSLREQNCPTVDWVNFKPTSSDWTLDADYADVVLSNLTLGVVANYGPIPIANVTADDIVNATVKNGKLPAGIKLVSDEDGLYLRGTPTKAGDFTCELWLTAKILNGKKYVTTSGTSVRLTVNVRDLGDIIGTYDGYEVRSYSSESATPGCGTATFTVAKTGAISGKLVLDGTNVTFKGTSWSSRTNDTFYLATTAKLGKQEFPLTLAVDMSEAPTLGIDAPLALNDRLYWLNRNRWKTVEGKARVAPLVGQYVAALFRSASTDSAPEATGYISLTIKADGSVTYSGYDSLGLAFSGKSTLYYALDCCNVSGYHWGFYLYAKSSNYKGADTGLYGLVEILPSEDGYLLTSTGEAPIRNVGTETTKLYANCAWTNELEAVGGIVPSSAAFSIGDTWTQVESFAAPSDFNGRDGTSGYTLTSQPTGLTLSISAKSKPEIAANDWNVKFSTYAAKTSIATLRIPFTYTAESASGKVTTKTRTITARGVYVPVSEYGTPFWAGFYTLPETVSREVNGKTRNFNLQTPFSWLFQ